MASRTEKDRAKAQQEKFQAILSNFLKDEDNKYCVDCDAKGPRWASWNLGIFLCIRCAGIHRNLGVHISKVKSVNLDTWTAEQIAMMQEMGNSRARAVYEANIPDGFRRPQTDSALEAFIRAKYEQKKYIAKEWVPPRPVVPKEYIMEWLEDDRADKKKIRGKPVGAVGQSSNSASSPVAAEVKPVSSAPLEAKPQAQAQPLQQAQAQSQPQPVKPKSGTDDLLGLDFSISYMQNAEPVPVQTSAGQNDLLADLFGGSSSAGLGGAGQQNITTGQQNGLAEANLFESGGGGNTEGFGEKKSAKDSIMALYGSGGQQQMFGVPGYGMTPTYMVVSATHVPSSELLVPEKWTSAPASKPEVSPPSANMWGYPSVLPPGMGDYSTQCNASMYYYAAGGGMYVPQQMYGNMGMGVPMMQQQPGMVGQPLPQGMIGMQPPMYGGMGQMVSSQMPGGLMGRQPNMMGTGMYMPQGGMQQVPAQVQQINQIQLNQMQQQMAAMKLGSGQVSSMQQPPAAAAGGMVWGGASAGHTLSTNLWQ
ncbi:stromal membrane-associated protein 1-like isoform X1 [Pomacea canaliculata]|uniref:stromal membrane-associated protein 1-like isoform X1 n=1 Tax=Pomacea canaliculata TaxID=400727 RepID=UPI000D73D33B|nr:stromal membrane-associated protein 1-like isoform X1 [Pomacea canaliculata]